MGMLSEFIQGAAKKATGEVMDDNIKSISEDELLKQKTAIEIEKEKRIEEVRNILLRALVDKPDCFTVAVSVA
jgi:hypothetical protein